MRCLKKRGLLRRDVLSGQSQAGLRPVTALQQRRRFTQWMLATPLLWCASPRAFADDTSRVRYAEIVRADEGYVVNADIEMELNARLVDALHRGVALHFLAEFVVEKERWYWLDEEIVSRHQRFRLTYHSITRNYHLNNGVYNQTFESLEAAMNNMLTIRQWPIIGWDGLQPGVSYHASLRFGHDISMLPKTFQVTAISSREWNQSTDWLDWTFLAGVP